MTVLTAIPKYTRAMDTVQETKFVSSVASWFRQILIPALALCDALLTTLGTQNHSCVIHVTHFLLSHVECVDCVLRASHPNSPQGLLIELEALTSVIARASNQEVFGLVQHDTALQHSAASVERVQRLMMALLPRFQHSPDQQDSTTYYKIVCNLLTYARNILETEGTRALLSASVATKELELRDGELPAATCGAVLRLLQNAVDRTQHHEKLLATAQHQLANVSSYSCDDMKKLLPPEQANQSPTEMRAAVVSLLRDRVRTRRLEVQWCSHAVESALYLVWAHARVYLRLAAVPSVTYPLTPSKAWRGAGGDDLPELRKALVAVFNDRFADQLIETGKNQPPAQRGFLEVLMKDIKSMIQFSPL